MLLKIKPVFDLYYTFFLSPQGVGVSLLSAVFNIQVTTHSGQLWIYVL